MDYNCRRVFITGASRGLGLCLAKKYLEEGHTVYAGVRNPGSDQITKLHEQFPELKIYPLDVSDTGSVENCFRLLSQDTGHLDILINNAAIQAETSFNTIETTDIDEALAVYNTNALGPLRVVRSFLPILKNTPAALIVNISSGAGSIQLTEIEKEYDYRMSKAALNMGTKILYNYFRGTNIRIAAVDPGWLDTDMGKRTGGYLDPYVSATKLYGLFGRLYCNEVDFLFANNEGNTLPW
ncbi:MAG TPA: SDR family oxidoreductase [Clostridiales bacterium]|mgnify:FL=1|nr:SDR family oxidoreductase [Clostridiales bacterium]